MEGFAAALGDGRIAMFLPAALMLGALHALEPGHAKAMMASFIVATRGTPARAVALGLAAALSHSLVVWALVLTALWLGLDVVPESWRPYLALCAGAAALALAGWMGWRQWRGGGHGHSHHHHGHDHGHDHGHHHHHHGHAHPHEHAHGHAHHHHGHHHHHAAPARPGGIPDPGWWGTIWFGFSGGLIPCPAALSVLLLCLQAGAASIGVLMVGAFSIGLALVLVGVGLGASLAAGLATRRMPALARLGERAPWLSVAVIAASGLYTILHALASVPHL